jgi:hypothetical protein
MDDKDVGSGIFAFGNCGLRKSRVRGRHGIGIVLPRAVERKDKAPKIYSLSEQARYRLELLSTFSCRGHDYHSPVNKKNLLTGPTQNWKPEKQRSQTRERNVGIVLEVRAHELKLKAIIGI